MVGYFRYENKDVLLVRNAERIIAKDKSSGRIVETPLDDLTRNLSWEPTVPRVKWRGVVARALAIVALLTATVVQSRRALIINGSFALSIPLFSITAVWFFCYTVGQTFLHEMAHILSFRLQGGHPDKFGFCLDYYVIPSFYVRMNDLALLLPSDRAAVHLAGIVVNSMLNFVVSTINVTLIHSGILTFIVALFTIGIIINFLPVLNSDGYKTLLSVLDVHEKKEYRKNGWVVMIVNVLSWIFVVVSVSMTLSVLVRKFV